MRFITVLDFMGFSFLVLSSDVMNKIADALRLSQILRRLGLCYNIYIYSSL